MRFRLDLKDYGARHHAAPDSKEAAMKRSLITLAMLAAAAPAVAGVVYQVETTDMTGSGSGTMQSTISADGPLLKMQMHGAGDGFNGEMIYRGDRREMVMVNHDEKTVMVMDEATIKAMADQISQAMAAMEQALAAMPASQRAKMEQMMKSKMPAMPEPSAPAEIKATGDGDTINGYPTTRYDVWRDGIRQRELWITDWANVDGGEEVAETFQQMAAFMQSMFDNLPNIGGIRSAGNTAFAYLKEMKGFPVKTREFADSGAVEYESVLVSSEERNLDPSTFEPPKGYKQQDLKKMMKGQ
jgi:hypothetical protein